ncbi:hypothetical protein OZX67_08040 [Bifidobacterium sp. ESL0728]|uniref:hypothetical protein n=1 Tax=Bifidobacterium sp. ESL0728 TaxID=2983220 RepID=UPI0023F97AED|nr:hypothetical protein [Bifidobacterium sp. ESL0728]WEV58734.1 hypothetical protein OZX67_08040 [Bifidobacterium sp. ESL0728]
MNEINEEPIVHPRIHRRHPEICDEDVRSAWHTLVEFRPRNNASGRWSAIGVDGKGRLLELVFSKSEDGHWKIFHAKTPPTKAILKELGLLKGGQYGNGR